MLGVAWEPVTALFGNGEVGAVYDPSDFSTLFQDSAGTTPVTANGQPVGLLLDKSKGLVLGAELVTVAADRDFSSDTGYWTKMGFVTISGGAAHINNPDGSLSYLSRTGLTTAGKTYTVTLDAVVRAGAARLTNSAGDAYASITASGAKSFTFVATGTGILGFTRLGVTDVDLDNISVRELPGNHARQTTLDARPTYRTAPSRIDYDGVNDALVTAFAASLGTDCTVCRAVPGVGASILTGQTIGTTYTDTTDHAGLIIVNRALTAAETASVTAYLNLKAGV
jgi:hypothetical protein